MLALVKESPEFQSAPPNLPSPMAALEGIAREHTTHKIMAGIATAADIWRLSRRQREVLVLSAQGLTNKQMAFELGCHTKTIEVHITGLLKKAGVSRRNELVAKLIHTYT